MQLATLSVIAACALAVGAESAHAAKPTPSKPFARRVANEGGALRAAQVPVAQVPAAQLPAAQLPAAQLPAARVPARPPAAPPTWARAYAQEQWSATIELIETIPEASRTVWHWLHLARALEKRTQLVESFAAYERLLDLAAEDKPLRGVKDAERQARSESGALEHRIPWAQVALGEDLPAEAFVWVDQQWLEPNRLRSPYPVNPGWHTFLVEANGEVLAARRVYFEEGQSRWVPLVSFGERGPERAVAIAAEHTEVERAVGPAPTASGRRQLTWRTDSAPIDSDRQGQLLRASYASLGVGVLGAAVGTGFAVAAANNDDAAGASAALASYAIGFGALITGGVFWLMHRDNVRSSASHSSTNVAKLVVEPRIYPSGAVFRATF